MRIVSMVLIGLLAGMAGAEEAGFLSIETDFVARYTDMCVANALNAAATGPEKMGGEAHPGIFLHPVGEGDATATFTEVAVPAAADQPFLVFYLGIREGVEWESPTARPNGVRFSVRINGEEVFGEELRESVWRGRAVDLRAWAGQPVTVVFATNAIGRNTSYDWSLFGDPLLIALHGVNSPEALSAESVGMALARISCRQACAATLRVGESTTPATLSPGESWLPVAFSEAGALQLETEPAGAAEIVERRYALHAPKLELKEFALGTPLVTVGHPVNVVLRVKNSGRGAYSGGLKLGLRALEGAAFTELAALPEMAIDALPPGGESTVVWEGLAAAEKGDVLLGLAQTPSKVMEVPPLAVHVFPPEPVSVQEKGGDIRFCAALNGPNPATRLLFVEDEDGQVYTRAKVWDGAAELAVGSVYPLASAAFYRMDAAGKRVLARDVYHGMSGLVSENFAECQGTIAGQPVRLYFTPDAEKARVRMEATFEAAEDIELLVFTGPQILAGDRAYGAGKDFAIFPGLEYLEGAEASSSERDLAYPLSNRRVPAVHKITAPLMAVQGQETLAALLWDMAQPWAKGERYPAAQFVAPALESGYQRVLMSLSAPGVGAYRDENADEARVPFKMKKGEVVSITSWLALDHASRYGAESIVHGPHRGGLALQAFTHYFDLFGVPAPSPQPREWPAEERLCLEGYLQAVWNADPPGWKHCYGWAPGLLVGHALPQLLALPDITEDSLRAEIQSHVSLVLDRAVREQGPQYLWSNGGCHILMGELPFYEGYLGESLIDFRNNARGRLAGRENGRWVWRPANEKQATLGVDGGDTLSQAAQPLMVALRAARFTGDAALAAEALDAMRQMEEYEVPRGAQTWECPLYQPDILAAAQAIRAYTEAYRLTGDPKHLAQARYWAWTGLPFLYLWEMEGYPTMRYNVISVIGSTFYTHSWLGLPVVWCGMVYGYALQDFAEFDASFDWRGIAQGITNSAMHQQYAAGPNAGTYPDSWNMLRNKPNPADINPENILVNELRLRGRSPEIRFHRVPCADRIVVLNSAADISDFTGSVEEGAVSFTLRAPYAAYSLLAPVARPAAVEGCGEEAGDSGSLRGLPAGWLYDAELQGILLKNGSASIRIAWQ